MTSAPPITSLSAHAYTVPTDQPEESDGTLTWDHTTIVVVQAAAGAARGLGYSYTHRAAADVVVTTLRSCVEGRPVTGRNAAWWAMFGAVRNLGRPGLSATAISAVDACLWDLEARWLGVPLCDLLGTVHDRVPIYGSGGFTSYSCAELVDQLGGWVDDGITRVKMKVGRVPTADVGRVAEVRRTIGPTTELFVDANGGYTRQQALAQAEMFDDYGVSWFEEPVSSDDLAGLRLVRDGSPAGMRVAAGEYAYDSFAFRHLLEAGAVDVLQADATRCCGITGFLAAAELARSHNLQLSAHCAPSLHVHVAAAVANLAPLEYFHDHVRIEHLLFDGALDPVDGQLVPDRERPGLGLELKHADAERFAA